MPIYSLYGTTFLSWKKDKKQWWLFTLLSLGYTAYNKKDSVLFLKGGHTLHAVPQKLSLTLSRPIRHNLSFWTPNRTVMTDLLTQRCRVFLELTMSDICLKQIVVGAKTLKPVSQQATEPGCDTSSGRRASLVIQLLWSWDRMEEKKLSHRYCSECIMQVWGGKRNHHLQCDCV